VVRFGERNLLIGTTAQSVRLLAEEDMLGVEARTPAPRSVADLLRADEAVDFEEELKQAGDALNDLPTDWQTGGGQA
nr:flagellar biosynthetic protein FliO [Acidobacteriota bacterium]